MANGRIDETPKSITKDVVALLLILIGVVITIGGVKMMLGWGGVFTLAGVVLTALGVRLGLSRTGKE